MFGINNTLTLRHFAAALTDSRSALLDTIALAVMAAVAAAILGTLIAYYIARTALAGRNVLAFAARHASRPCAISASTSTPANW